MNILHIILYVLLILGMLYVFIGYKEGFVSSYGSFPCSNESPILQGDYPVVENATLSAKSYSDNSKLKSYTSMSSYEQKTNNVENWVTPDNGRCSPADFCGALYDKKVFDNDKVITPNDNDGVRVNFFVSS